MTISRRIRLAVARALCPIKRPAVYPGTIHPRRAQPTDWTYLACNAVSALLLFAALFALLRLVYLANADMDARYYAATHIQAR